MARSRLATRNQETTKLLGGFEHLAGKSISRRTIQSYGPDGVYEREVRQFRYILSTVDENGWKRTSKYPAATDVSPEMLAMGYYAFGANRFNVIDALDDELRHLESHDGLMH